MTDLATPDATATADRDDYAVATHDDAIRIQRLLPGPVERVWSYVTESDLRRTWLAAGEMPLAKDAEFTLTWRNDELTDPPGTRPEGMGTEHSATCRITAVEPPHHVAFTFGSAGHVTIDLERRGDRVLLTLVHANAPNRGVLRSVSTGWHAHLDVLAARVRGDRPAPFWDHFADLKRVYTARLGD